MISDCPAAQRQELKMPNENQKQGQPDKDKAKSDDKRLKTLEEGDDPNEVAPTGVGGSAGGSSKGNR
jgi:hypothetical protein